MTSFTHPFFGSHPEHATSSTLNTRSFEDILLLFKRFKSQLSKMHPFGQLHVSIADILAIAILPYNDRAAPAQVKVK